jgi:probable rRNA maturation factor
MIDVAIDNRSGLELPLERVADLASFVLAREAAERGGAPDGLELSLSFVSKDEIRQLNAAYRDKDVPTDVLSFGLDDPWADAGDVVDADVADVVDAGAGDVGAGATGDAAGATGDVGAGGTAVAIVTTTLVEEKTGDVGAGGTAGHLLLGDIVIQPDIARERAVAEEVDFETELWILVIHGILHLVGYDHLMDEDAAVMEAREDEHLFRWELSLDTR